MLTTTTATAAPTQLDAAGLLEAPFPSVLDLLGGIVGGSGLVL
ncbi:hypothetical protein ACFW5I_32830 [Streptomyces sp. NPDC058818]